MFSPCLEVNTLPEFVMIAGNSELLEFTVFNSKNEPVDLTGSTIKWTLAPYGQLDNNVCEIAGIMREPENPGEIPNVFTVDLQTQFTIDLEHGKYIQQPVIIDLTGEQNRLGQGIITILNEIPLM